MDKRLVTESYAYIRKEARGALKGKWVEATIGMMLFYVFTVFIRNILNLLIGNSVDVPFVQGKFITLTISGNLYDLLTTPIFTFGLMAMILVIARESKVNMSLLFSGFEFYLKLLALSIVMAIKIILWSFLLVIPGIIAAINYSQAYFIFFDNPSKGVFECINESIYLMRGNKLNFFSLLITFIGWGLLAGVATQVLNLPLPMLQMGPYFDQLYIMVSYIPTAIVLVYMYVAEAKFYELLHLSNVEGKRVVDPITGEYYVEPVEVEVEEEE